MSRYIDADALKAFIRNKYFQCDMPEEWGNGVMWATSQINRYCNKVAPSIDIVRCKECKWYDLNAHECTGEVNSTDHEGGASYSLNFYDDDFCSYGEREGE